MPQNQYKVVLANNVTLGAIYIFVLLQINTGTLVGVPSTNHDVPIINQAFLVGESNTSQESDYERECKTPTDTIMKAVVTPAMIIFRDHFKKPENEYQLMAFKLEPMSAQHRRLAEKFFNEILFEGEEGNLHRHSVIINQSAILQAPSPIPHIRSPISASSYTIEQEFLSTEEPVIVNIPDIQTNKNSSTEADTAEDLIKSFYSF
ncbi:hypothetical protein FQA39_LY07557 [Lamprigera yunnana]|nr:hypothetical protein FQA39_LY07557 [Lamprigera yunnana]